LDLSVSEILRSGQTIRKGGTQSRGSLWDRQVAEDKPRGFLCRVILHLLHGLLPIDTRSPAAMKGNLQGPHRVQLSSPAKRLEESHLAHIATLREQYDFERRKTQRLEKEVANLHSALARAKDRSKNLGNLAATVGAILLGIGGALPSL